MKTAAIPQVRVEPALREQLDAVLADGETLSDFVEAAVRRAVEYRRVQRAFLEKGEAAWNGFLATGQSVDAEEVLAALQARLNERRAKFKAR
jgi:predicted transcriptional regulator